MLISQILVRIDGLEMTYRGQVVGEIGHRGARGNPKIAETENREGLGCRGPT